MDQTSYGAQCPLVFVSEGLQYNLIGVMPGHLADSAGS